MDEPRCRVHGEMYVAEEGVLNGVERRYYACATAGCRRETKIDVVKHVEPSLLGDTDG